MKYIKVLKGLNGKHLIVFKLPFDKIRSFEI